MDYTIPGFSVLHYLPEFAQAGVCWVSDAIQPSHPLPLLLLPRSFPASQFFPRSGLFGSGGQSRGASASASVLPMNIQSWFSLVLISLISLSAKDSQEYSPAPQFEGINSSLFTLLYGPTQLSVHNYWKNHGFYYMDFCRQRYPCFLVH